MTETQTSCRNSPDSNANVEDKTDSLWSHIIAGIRYVRQIKQAQMSVPGTKIVTVERGLLLGHGYLGEESLHGEHKKGPEVFHLPSTNSWVTISGSTSVHLASFGDAMMQG